MLPVLDTLLNLYWILGGFFAFSFLPFAFTFLWGFIFFQPPNSVATHPSAFQLPNFCCYCLLLLSLSLWNCLYKQGEKTAFRIGENNSKWNNWQRINLQNIQATHTAQYQKNKQPNQKIDAHRCTTSFIIRKIQIKTTVRYHFRLSEWPPSRSLQKINSGEGMEKREPSYTVGGNADTATMENSVEIPLKTGNRTAIWPSNPSSGHTHWGNQNWKRHMNPNVHCSTVCNS